MIQEGVREGAWGPKLYNQTRGGCIGPSLNYEPTIPRRGLPRSPALPLILLEYGIDMFKNFRQSIPVWSIHITGLNSSIYYRRILRWIYFRCTVIY